MSMTKRLKEGAFKEEIIALESIAEEFPIDTRESPDLAAKVRAAIEDLPEDLAERRKVMKNASKNNYDWQRTYFVAWEQDEGRYRGIEVTVRYENNPDDRTDDTGILDVTLRNASRRALV